MIFIRIGVYNDAIERKVCQDYYYIERIVPQNTNLSIFDIRLNFYNFYLISFLRIGFIRYVISVRNFRIYSTIYLIAMHKVTIHYLANYNCGYPVLCSGGVKPLVAGVSIDYVSIFGIHFRPIIEQ